MDEWAAILWTLGPPVVVVALLIAVFIALSRVGGWWALSVQYRDLGASAGRSFHMQSAQFAGWVGYNRCLTFGASAFGVRISIWPMFRWPAHPTLLVPWSDLHAESEKRWWIHVVTLRFVRCPYVVVRIHRKLAERLAAESGGAFAAPPPL